MSSLKETIKNSLPDPAARLVRAGLDAWANAKLWPAATFHPWRRDSVRRLAAFKDKHHGERCFIVGNGPSLRQTDLSKLNGEVTFGLNRIFLAFPELGFTTTYLVSINDLVIEQSAAEIQALEMPKFISWRARRWLRPAENLYFLHTTYKGKKFARDARERIWEGATVTNVALQLAFYMGFEQVILIGVDHNFATQGKPNTTVVSEGDDPNHFSAAYFGKGFRWQLPDLEVSEEGYRQARQVFEAAGRSVVDATVGGKLTVFPKVDYNRLFDSAK